MDQKITSTNDISPFLPSKGYIAIHFQQNVAGLLLVQAKINDVEGVYILDSGAGQTVIDSKRSATLKLTLKHDESSLSGGGVGAHSIENAPSYNNKIEIGNFKMDNLVVAVMSLETAWESLARVGSHDELYGIIGVDILKTGNAIIDFGSMTLYLNNNS